MSRLLISLVCVFLAAAPVPAQAKKRPMTIDDLFAFKRVSDPQISPDGKHVAYVITTVDLPGNKSTSTIWLAPTTGGQPRQLTNTTKKDGHPRWSPDGKHILFESNRSGENQLWVIALDGGEARQLTTIATEASTGLWSPDGTHIAFVSAVYPEFSEKPYAQSNALNKKKKEEKEKNPVKAKVFTKLFYRHWSSYVEDLRQHLFVIPFAPTRSVSEGVAEPKDVTPGDRDAYPTSMTFETGDNYTFSPDGKYLVFTAVPAKDEAWSTNYDICRVPISGGTKDWECLTKANPAADSGPRFSPDGKRLAYRAQKKAGYEADKWELMVASVEPDGRVTGKPSSVTSALDRSVDAIVWLADSKKLLVPVEELAETTIYRMDGSSTQPPFPWAKRHGTVGSLTVSRDGRSLACMHARMSHPPEVGVMSPGDQSASLEHRSHANLRLLSELDRQQSESVTVPGADDTPMQMWILKPPSFDPSKKWPLVYLVHGGPQGAWEDGWSYRWNPQLWAAQGYVVALPNPRGSTGFGQKYVEEISGDWGGKCYQDLMKGVDYLEKLPYIDRDRMAAAGASFGGYMMNWFAVNTGRFKCLIGHCGVWNFESMYGTTDEVWFDEYEHGGPPWGKNRHSYEKHSPHRLAGNLGKFKTPMLVIQNDLDFRCPIGQGHELFTALQRQGVPSRFINFPDEGHWVLKPANSKYWHQEVFGWLTKHVPAGGR